MDNDLIEFLRARLKDDEWAIEGTWTPPGGPSCTLATMQGTTVMMRPARALAEIGSKRQIVDAYLPPGGDPHPGLPCTNDIEGDPDGELYATMLFPDACVRHLKASERLLHHDYVLRLLALPYDSHPDYRQEWKP